MMNIQQMYVALQGMKKKSKTIWIVAGVILVLGLLAVPGADEPVFMGVFFTMTAAMVVGFYYLVKVAQGAGLKKSLSTLERTGKLDYVKEILSEAYTPYDKLFVSQHLIFVPGQAIVAIEDIVNIRIVKYDYVFDTIDGKYHRVRIAVKTMNAILKQYPQLPVNLPYKDYKDKIDAFKFASK